MRLNSTLLFLFCGVALAQSPGSLTVQVGGRTIGTRSTLNLVNAAGTAPSGIVQVCSDNPTANRVDCSSSYNSALLATHDTVHANENYCSSTNGTTAYTCRLQPKALTSYSPGMTFLLNIDATCIASCTVNIDNIGIVNIKRSDGATDPGGLPIAGQPQWIFYDGRVFRLVSAGAAPGGAAASSSPLDQRGDVIARRLIASMDTMPYAATITLDVTAGDLHKTTTSNSAGSATINASTGGLPGQHMWIIIANDLISGKTIAFGTNLRSSGTLAGTPGKSCTVQFVSDGAAWYEVARTLNL